ncbi:hypothetical protein NP493_614g00013 [Ridgeia piscesae]|uniref:Ig-like domain-containing protein n=1 Tax=Ridgeia piscesae TaxID=27915 RepID=A0AAD9KTT9_RIDPI|nr:hypothetical protein NP493_614g00013 [Ridgeia piscesae]
MWGIFPEENKPKCDVSSPHLINDTVLFGEAVTYACSATYRGRWAPAMKWRVVSTHADETGRKKRPEVRIFVADESTKHNAAYTFSIAASRHNVNRSFKCIVHFDRPTKSPGWRRARNIPDYRFDCVVEPLIVLSAPRNLAIDPVRRTYGAGDELEAKADAYPPASFVWVLAGEHKILSETSHLLVTEEMTHDWALEVRAYNEFRNETHSVSMKILVTRRLRGIEVAKWVALGTGVFILAALLHYLRSRPDLIVPGPRPVGDSVAYMTIVRSGLVQIGELSERLAELSAHDRSDRAERSVRSERAEHFKRAEHLKHAEHPKHAEHAQHAMPEHDLKPDIVEKKT